MSIQQIIHDAAARAAADAHKKRLDEIVKIQAAYFDKSIAYANVIMAVGYAGFFAVWANMKQYMSPTEMRVAALSVLIALSVHIVWELFKMVHLTIGNRGIQAVIDKPVAEFAKALEAHQLALHWRNRVLHKVWPFAFWTSVVAASVGGATLVCTFVRGLLP